MRLAFKNRVALSLAMFGIFLIPGISQSETIDSIIAIVNGTIITKSDLNKQRQRLKKGTIVDDLFGKNAEDLLKDEKLFLRQTIDEKVVDGEVKKQNLNITMEKVEQEINSIQARNNITREQLAEALKKEGTSFSDYQDFIKHRLERQGLIQKAITSKINISDEDVAAQYESKNKNVSAKSFEYRLAHILLRQGKRSDEAQLKRAEEVMALLKAGRQFEDLASEYSEDPNYNEGGFLGSFKSGEFFKPLEDAARATSAGEWAGPVKTKLGYHVIKVLEKKAVADPDFEKKKEVIRGDLYQAAFVKQFQFWLEQKRQESYIRIN